MYGFIYITTNKINGKKYIGQKKYNGREHRYLGSGVYFKNAVKKYGKENFIRETICECETKELLDEAEKRYIKIMNAVESDNFYNISSGGINNINMCNRNKIAINLENNKIIRFTNRVEFCSKYNIKNTCLTDVLKNKIKYTGKYYIFYENDLNEELLNSAYYEYNRKNNVYMIDLKTYKKKKIGNVQDFSNKHKIVSQLIHKVVDNKKHQYLGKIFYVDKFFGERKFLFYELKNGEKQIILNKTEFARKNKISISSIDRAINKNKYVKNIYRFTQTILSEDELLEFGTCNDYRKGNIEENSI